MQEELNKVLALKSDSKFQEMEASLKELAKVYPNSCSVHALMGYAQWEQGKMQEAKESFQRAVKINPKSELARLALNLFLTMGF